MAPRLHLNPHTCRLRLRQPWSDDLVESLTYSVHICSNLGSQLIALWVLYVRHNCEGVKLLERILEYLAQLCDQFWLPGVKFFLELVLYEWCKGIKSPSRRCAVEEKFLPFKR